MNYAWAERRASSLQIIKISPQKSSLLSYELSEQNFFPRLQLRHSHGKKIPLSRCVFHFICLELSMIREILTGCAKKFSIYTERRREGKTLGSAVECEDIAGKSKLKIIPIRLNRKVFPLSISVYSIIMRCSWSHPLYTLSMKQDSPPFPTFCGVSGWKRRMKWNKNILGLRVMLTSVQSVYLECELILSILVELIEKDFPICPSIPENVT